MKARLDRSIVVLIVWMLHITGCLQVTGDRAKKSQLNGPIGLSKFYSYPEISNGVLSREYGREIFQGTALGDIEDHSEARNVIGNIKRKRKKKKRNYIQHTFNHSFSTVKNSLSTIVSSNPLHSDVNAAATLKETLQSDGRRKTKITNTRKSRSHRRSEFIAANDKDNENGEEPDDGYLLKPKSDEQETAKDDVQLASFLQKLRRRRARPKAVVRGRVNVKKYQELNDGDDDDEVLVLQSIYTKKQKKKQLTNLFVRFMEDMTQKLKLDPLAVADLLIQKMAIKRSKISRSFSNPSHF